VFFLFQKTLVLDIEKKKIKYRHRNLKENFTSLFLCFSHAPTFWMLYPSFKSTLPREVVLRKKRRNFYLMAVLLWGFQENLDYCWGEENWSSSSRAVFVLCSRNSLSLCF
jgi:hypothetical protein